MKSILNHKFEDIIREDIISIENLLLAWQEFIKGKRNKQDVQIFQFNLMDNIFQLHEDLKNTNYKHGGYQQFKINDTKPRTIHKASVRDRLLHHAVYRILYPLFDRTFIADSYSCRNNKGTHKALNRFRDFSYIVSKNNTKTCWILKCDIKKFFASIDQMILIKILEKRIPNKNILSLLEDIIFSYRPNGLPLGNLTSQLFANVYLNEFDQFIKHKLRIKYYIKYADDFVIFGDSKKLINIVSKIHNFLQDELKLNLHPNKIYFRRLKNGIDFLGWINIADYRVLRNKTKRRMLVRMRKNPNNKTLNSYMGLLKHGNSCRIKENILNKITWQS